MIRLTMMKAPGEAVQVAKKGNDFEERTGMMANTCVGLDFDEPNQKGMIAVAAYFRVEKRWSIAGQAGLANPPGLSFRARRSVLAALAFAMLSAPAFSLEAIDRINHRNVEILALIGGDNLGIGSLLELALEDTREVITGEVIAIRRVGHNLELEILDRHANNHFFIEFSADGISEIHR